MRMPRASRSSKRAVCLATILAASTLSSVVLAEPSAGAQAPGAADAGGPPPGDAGGRRQGPPAGEGRGPRHGPPPFEDVLERNADRLGLDAKTRAEIRSIAAAAREKGRGLEEGLRGLHEEMRGILDQATPDLDAALRQAERIGAAETELHKLRLESMLKIRALLTPAQREELVRIHEERRRARGAGGPPGPLTPGGDAGGAPPPGAEGEGPPPPGGPPPGPPPDAW